MFTILCFSLLLVQEALCADTVLTGYYGCDIELPANHSEYLLPDDGDFVRWSKGAEVIFNYRISNNQIYWDAAYESIGTAKYDINNQTYDLVMKNLTDSDSEDYTREKNLEQFSIELIVADVVPALNQNLQIQNVETGRVVTSSETLYACLNDVVTLNATTTEIVNSGVPDISWGEEVGTSGLGFHSVVLNTGVEQTLVYQAESSICDTTSDPQTVTFIVQDIETVLCNIKKVQLDENDVTSVINVYVNDIIILTLVSPELLGLGYPSLTWQNGTGTSTSGSQSFQPDTSESGTFIYSYSCSLCGEICSDSVTIVVEDDRTSSGPTTDDDGNPAPVGPIVGGVLGAVCVGIVGIIIGVACYKKGCCENKPDPTTPVTTQDNGIKDPTTPATTQDNGIEGVDRKNFQAKTPKSVIALSISSEATEHQPEGQRS